MAPLRDIHDMLLEQPLDLPVFNPVALELLQLLDEADIHYFRVIMTIKKDQALSSMVLKMSNSPSYAGRGKCETIENSAIRLGTQQIANIAIAASHSALHTSHTAVVNGIMPELWRHSHACALGCRWIAQKTGHQSLADHAYMAGLLHDIGKLYLLKALEQLSSRVNLNMVLMPHSLQNIFSALHVEFGCRIMEHWNIPPVYREIVAGHHRDSAGSDDFLLALVKMVNYNSVGFNINSYPSAERNEAAATGFSGFMAVDPDLERLCAVMTESRDCED